MGRRRGVAPESKERCANVLAAGERLTVDGTPYHEACLREAGHVGPCIGHWFLPVVTWPAAWTVPASLGLE